jgi:hypothetical protein
MPRVSSIMDKSTEITALFSDALWRALLREDLSPVLTSC